MGRRRKFSKRRRVRHGGVKRVLRRALIAGVILWFAAPAIERALRAADQRHLPLIALLMATGGLSWRARRAWRVRRRIGELAVSDRARDYLIDEDDYRRATPREAAYRRTMQLTLLATFDNRCAKCGRRDDGVDLDHFFLPKVDGGSFIMRHRDGYLVNNAIPLCVHCNRSKSARSYRRFFAAAELPALLEKNQRLTALLNERAPLDHHGVAKPRRRGDRAA